MAPAGPAGGRQGGRRRPPPLRLWGCDSPPVLAGRIAVQGHRQRFATASGAKGTTVSALRVKSRKKPPQADAGKGLKRDPGK